MRAIPMEFLLICIALFTLCHRSLAAETDQYTFREIPLNDAAPELNRHIEELIQKALENHQYYLNPYHLQKHVRWRIEGVFSFRRLTYWAASHPQIQAQETWDDGIFRHIPFFHSVTRITHRVAPTIHVGNTRMGTDKLSHLFSVGWEYFKNYRTHGETEMIRLGNQREGGILGKNTTGVYSHADVVANFEGYRFYRSLTEDNIIPGKRALIDWHRKHPKLQRPFEIQDFVNPYFDESINTSTYQSRMGDHISETLRKYCPLYHKTPQLWDLDPDIDQQLQKRYEILHLGNNTQYRLSNVCRQ